MSEWIQIEDSLPSVSGSYLVYTKINYEDWDVRIGWFIESDGMFWDRHLEEIAVSHWTYKPKPPETK